MAQQGIKRFLVRQEDSKAPADTKRARTAAGTTSEPCTAGPSERSAPPASDPASTAGPSARSGSPASNTAITPSPSAPPAPRKGADGSRKTGAGYTHLIGWKDLGAGAQIGYWPAYIEARRAAAIFKQLKAEAAWGQHELVIYGKKVLEPRLTAYYADIDTGQYTYSNLTWDPIPFTPLLRELKQDMEALTGHKFNSVLLNMYRNGEDSVAWHSDDEKMYGENSTIASLTFGQGRDFLMRRKPVKNGQHGVKASSVGDDSHKFLLGQGDVFVMRGTMQKHWQHCVPKRKTQPGTRINLTFRTIVRTS